MTQSMLILDKRNLGEEMNSVVAYSWVDAHTAEYYFKKVFKWCTRCNKRRAALKNPQSLWLHTQQNRFQLPNEFRLYAQYVQRTYHVLGN